MVVGWEAKGRWLFGTSKVCYHLRWSIDISRYTKIDDTKLKELNLTIERLSKEVEERKRALAQEITETQAAQIELDKTAEDFRNLDKERSALIKQWEEAIENMRKRDKMIQETGEKFAQGK